LRKGDVKIKCSQRFVANVRNIGTGNHYILVVGWQWGDELNQNIEDKKRDISTLIDEETQLAMMKFFLHTSVPRILKQIEAESKDSSCGERDK